MGDGKTTLDFTGGPSISGALGAAEAIAPKPAAPAPPKAADVLTREATFVLRDVLDPKTGARHVLSVTATADGAANMGPAFWALVARFTGNAPWEAVPLTGQVLAQAYARIKAQVKDLGAEAERLILGDEGAAVGLGEALLAFERRWFRRDPDAGADVARTARVETPWTDASEPPAG